MSEKKLHIVTPPKPEEEHASVTPEVYKQLKEKAKKQRQRGYRKDSKPYAFYESKNWELLKRDFFYSKNKDGTFLWMTAYHFISERLAKTNDERMWAEWIIGPEPVREVPWLGNWNLERFSQYWTQDKRVRVLSELLGKEVNAIQLGFAVAPMFAEQLGRILDMMQQVDEFFKTRMYLPGLTDQENIERMETYLDFQKKLSAWYAQVVEDMLDAVGGPNRRITQQVMEATVDQTQEELGASRPEAVRKIMARIIDAAVERSKVFPQIPSPLQLPEETGEDKTVTLKRR